ncbi:unnamed protein product [Rotaria sordida]|uniref:Uncharacterized protein n=1 Tax=Rotaria sordida TaxID=392033 RepID=A0A819PRG0_9BILA|nr:unnamed protein product [Rotaria sordida]CAF1276707.1 unnamed protein product [Rotaria sordida]CAF3867956.1 unnamed protein product [Rotaria sordida]CAF4017422.1 unnamed protein product [Rotaria sordida]
MNFSKKSSCSTHHKHRYVPPYERLLRRNQLWKPQMPQNYLCYFIHEQTDILKIDELIDQAKLTNHFSIDTEDDALTHKPATLQIEFIRPTLPSIIIIIEVQYLPSITTPLFKKIQQLCIIIFTSNNHIYSWGSASQELGKFNSFNLFNTNIKIQEYNIQDEYSGDQAVALQKIIKYEFKEYLNKTATLAEWACGIDLALGTYLLLDVVGPERTYRIKEEKKYRSILKEYAINDIFAVTKLSYKLNLIIFLPTSDYEDISEDEDNLNIQQELSIDIQPIHEELIIHVTDELEDINDNNLFNKQQEDIEPIRPINNECYESHYNESLHVQHESMEFELHNESLLEIMKLHFEPEPSRLSIQAHHHHQEQSIEMMEVHVKDERHQVGNSYYLDSKSTITLTSKQIRNRKINRRHCANRYRFEVVRQVYELFSITKIKRILKLMNIYYVNINMVRHKLFIGLKNEKMVDEVETLFHDRIFTEQHYNRLYN